MELSTFQELFDQFYGKSESPFDRYMAEAFKVIEENRRGMAGATGPLPPGFERLTPSVSGSGDDIRTDNSVYDEDWYNEQVRKMDYYERMLRATMDPVALKRYDTRNLGGSSSYDPRL